MPTIRVTNKSEFVVECFISKFNGSGNDGWFRIQPEAQETWQRETGWELVAFRVINDNIHPSRTGVYIDVERVSRIEFNNTQGGGPVGVKVVPN